jgi:hypothetical protein
MVIPQPIPPEPPTPWEEFKAGLPESFDAFIAYIAGGGHMHEFAQTRGINYTTLLKFINSAPARSEMYAQAREDRADVLADEIVAISDEAEVTLDRETGRLKLDATAVARNKLRVDARKWAASKLKPRTYGDKLELGGTVNHKTLTDEQLLERLAGFGIAIAGITQAEGQASDDA